MIDIFFSYAHEDGDWVDRVRQQLVLFDRQGLIAKWYDRQILPGAKWKDQIADHLTQAGIILLFVSPNFFDSDYCYEVEMQRALRQHEEGRSVVIPIILRPCAWQTAPFGHLQALPKDGQPITEWPNRDRACTEVAEGIIQVVMELAPKPR